MFRWKGMRIMQEIIHYINFTFRILLTSYGMRELLVIIGLYAVYLFGIQRVHINVPTFVKLIGYPFMFTYGLFMLLVANVLEKYVVQRLGLFIMLMPIIISFLTSMIKENKSHFNNNLNH